MGRAEDLFEALTRDGESAIDRLIATGASEELFLDFKRSVNNGASDTLLDADRDNLSKAISGFGNSEGGVIVWGVEAKPLKGSGDVARTKIPIESPSRFRSLLEGAASGCTVPAHPHVRSHKIEIAGTDKGCVATYIRMSPLRPHQTVKDRKYYMRSGSNFDPVPHSVLRRVFGHPDPPMISHRINATQWNARVMH
jgi:predicted HTH transcriptional regulator